MKVIVTKEFVFDTSDFYRIAFLKGDIIEYSRYHMASDKTEGTFDHRIRIDRDNDTYFGEDFAIEKYTEEFKGLEDYPVETSSKNVNQHVQIQRIEGQSKTNKFLLGIPKENIIDIKPMEHNTYLVIYAEEEHEEGKV